MINLNLKYINNNEKKIKKKWKLKKLKIKIIG